MEWMGLVARRSFPVPSEGDTGRAFYRVTVWVLSWIYNLGECFMSFSLPPPPFLQPHAPFAAFPPPPLLSFQVTQSLHCTQGVVITGAAEIGQDKGTLPAQDVFPLSSLFFSTNLFPLLSCFPFASHVIQFLIFHIFVAHFSLMFLPYWLISLPIYQDLCRSGSFFSMEKQATLNIIQGFVFFSLCPN